MILPPTAADEARPPPTLFVCLTCRNEGDAADGPRPGRRLHDALAAALARADAPAVRLTGVECLSNCKRPCTIALGGPGRWTYVYGDLDPETQAPDILDGAARYAAAPDGLVPWRERPAIFRKGAIARVPPLPESQS